MQVGTFGPLTFEVSGDHVLTLANVKRDIKARYQEHQVLGAKPRLEFLAPELQVFTFTVTFSAKYVDIKGQLAALKTFVEEGSYDRLIIGGTNYGHHVITDQSEEWRNIMTAGVSLTLKEYIE